MIHSLGEPLARLPSGSALFALSRAATVPFFFSPASLFIPPITLRWRSLTPALWTSRLEKKTKNKNLDLAQMCSLNKVTRLLRREIWSNSRLQAVSVWWEFFLFFFPIIHLHVVEHLQLNLSWPLATNECTFGGVIYFFHRLAICRTFALCEVISGNLYINNSHISV